MNGQVDLFERWRRYWRRVLPGASAEEVGRRARENAGVGPATEELHDFLVKLQPEFRDFVFRSIEGAQWSGPEAALRAARSISQVMLRPEPLRGELVASILRDQAEGATAATGRAPGKASPPAIVPPPWYRRKKREEELTPEERTRAEEWKRQIEQGFTSLMFGGVQFPGAAASEKLGVMLRLKERFTPPEVPMTPAQTREWRTLVEAAKQGMKPGPWYERLPSGEMVMRLGAYALALKPPSIESMRKEWERVRPARKIIEDWWRFWQRWRGRYGGGGGGGGLG